MQYEDKFITIPIIKKLLIIEEGSVDLENLHLPPEIQVIVYRKGSPAPVLLDLMKGNNSGND